MPSGAVRNSGVIKLIETTQDCRRNHYRSKCNHSLKRFSSDHVRRRSRCPMPRWSAQRQYLPVYWPMAGSTSIPASIGRSTPQPILSTAPEKPPRGNSSEDRRERAPSAVQTLRTYFDSLLVTRSSTILPNYPANTKHTRSSTLEDLVSLQRLLSQSVTEVDTSAQYTLSFWYRAFLVTTNPPPNRLEGDPVDTSTLCRLRVYWGDQLLFNQGFNEETGTGQPWRNIVLQNIAQPLETADLLFRHSCVPREDLDGYNVLYLDSVAVVPQSDVTCSGA